MTNKRDDRNPGKADDIGPGGEIGMDPEAKEYLNELRADEDAAQRDWADDGECVDREFEGDPMDDLPEMEIILKNIYDM